MIRRAFITLIPAFAALTLLFGAPAHSATGPGATSAQWNAGAIKAPAIKRTFHEEAEAGSESCRASSHGEPDRIVRVVSIITWPPLTTLGGSLPTGPVVRHTHPACATPPRGPPTT